MKKKLTVIVYLLLIVLCVLGVMAENIYVFVSALFFQACTLLYISKIIEKEI